MKKLVCFIICMILLSICTVSLASVKINKKNFPDKNFREYIREFLDTNQDKKLSNSEIDQVVEIFVQGRSIKSLTGIERFPNLTTLNCSANKLKELNIGKNTKLQTLLCSSNDLTKLDITGNKALSTLNCSSNYDLKKLDLRKNKKLTHLYCEGCCLSKLNTSKNTQLEVIACSYNALTSLDLSKNTKLQELGCVGNNLTNLDLSKCPDLKKVHCWTNKIQTLDVRKCPILRDLVKTKSAKTEYRDDEQVHYWVKTDVSGSAIAELCANVKVKVKK